MQWKKKIIDPFHILIESLYNFPIYILEGSFTWLKVIEFIRRQVQIG